MTEVTITYTAEITETFTAMGIPENLEEVDIERFIKAQLGVDDVHVKNLKLFPREIKGVAT